VFTGLIETTGRLQATRRTSEGARLAIACAFAGELTRGESVAVNGVCLTVVASSAGSFEADAVAETLAASTLGGLSVGSRVNLERALKLGDRLGGHIVTGHVDGVGTVVERSPGRVGVELVVELPAKLACEVVRKGSIAIDGTSLTVAAVDGVRARIALIPETLAATISEQYHVGTRVNIETDVLAKHVRRLVEEATHDTGRASGGVSSDGDREGGLTLERLRELGF